MQRKAIEDVSAFVDSPTVLCHDSCCALDQGFGGPLVASKLCRSASVNSPYSVCLLYIDSCGSRFFLPGLPSPSFSSQVVVKRRIVCLIISESQFSQAHINLAAKGKASINTHLLTPSLNKQKHISNCHPSCKLLNINMVGRT